MQSVVWAFKQAMVHHAAKAAQPKAAFAFGCMSKRE
jgi:hypothetical protein